MADLTFIEKRTIENFLGMGGGYVMDFSNQTFQEFIIDCVGIDIYSNKYDYSSGSKANRLRAFIKEESNYTTGKLLAAFLDYWMSKVHLGEINFYDDEELYKECRRIEERLKRNNLVEGVDNLKPNSDDKDFKLLATQIKESIEKNAPEAALDRLHTFVIKYIRQLCDNHSIIYEKEETLHALFGKYVKHLTGSNLIESVMSERILKSSISILDAFNEIRNNKSLAHANSTLNYHESLLILNNISNAIRFIEHIENTIARSKSPTKERSEWDELPF